uniref:Uncharacterized protein n=1 Tax=Acrobeloides nanus TaxID=290746 RepID=A0A914DLU4_9BILA
MMIFYSVLVSMSKLLYKRGIIELCKEEEVNKENRCNISSNLSALASMKLDFTTANGQALEVRSQNAIQYAFQLAEAWSQLPNEQLNHANINDSDKSGSLFSNDSCLDICEGENNINHETQINDENKASSSHHFIPFAKTTNKANLQEKEQDLLTTAKEMDFIPFDMPSSHSATRPQSIWPRPSNDDSSPDEKRARFISYSTST